MKFETAFLLALMLGAVTGHSLMSTLFGSLWVTRTTTTAATRSSAGYLVDWDYVDHSPDDENVTIEGPTHWYHNYPSCGREAAKEAQSPVDVDTAAAVAAPDYYRALRFNYSEHTIDATMTNEGSTVKIAMPTDTEEVFQVTDGLGALYALDSMHFHWHLATLSGSEHAFDGLKAVAELHLVHYRKTFANLHDALASGQKRAVTVVAILYEIGEENTELTRITNAAKNRVHSMGSEYTISFNLRELFPNTYSGNDYYTYNGSLTTPPCTEVVEWNIMHTPEKITQQQLNSFRSIENGHETHTSASSESETDTSISPYTSNDRPLQPLNGRTVLHFTSTVVTPSSSSSSATVPKQSSSSSSARTSSTHSSVSASASASASVVSSDNWASSVLPPESKVEVISTDKSTKAAASAALAISLLILVGVLVLCAVFAVLQVKLMRG